MKLEEILQKYSFNESIEDIDKRTKETKEYLNPIYSKHLPVCWIIQDIYEHVNNGNLSLGKARELVSNVIEKHINDENSND